MIRLIIAVLVAIAPLAGHAQQSAGAAPATPDQPAQDDGEPVIVVEGERPKKICETRTDTGSIIPRRICRTPEQVAQDAERAVMIKDRLSRDRQTAQHTAESRGNR